VVRISRARRSGYKKSEESRQQVLDAAIAVLAEKGVAGTSVQDIANQARMSKGAVHYHFESKDELLERVLDRCCEVIEARIKAVFEMEGLPVERLHRALREMWIVRRDDVREMRVLTELRVLTRHNENLRKAYAEALRRASREIIDTGLAQLLAMGLKPKVSIEIVPRLLIATLDGLALQNQIDPVSADAQGEMMQAIEAATMALFEL
jgi:AcrR family transcriptional regulator